MNAGRWVALVVTFSLSIRGADAQCPQWTPGFERSPVLFTGALADFATFDTGAGPKLYVAGSFQAQLLIERYGLAV